MQEMSYIIDIMDDKSTLRWLGTGADTFWKLKKHTPIKQKNCK